MKMPKTRSQVNLDDLRRTRGSRKKRVTSVVVNCDPHSFDFTEFLQAAMGDISDPMMASTFAAEGAFFQGTSARTRPYYRAEGKTVKANVGADSQEDVKIIGERVNNRIRVFKPCKSVWITHNVVVPPSTGPVHELEKSSQESEIGVENGKQTCKSLMKIGARDVPRYLLDPNAFENDPVEKERILKSIYDRRRREKEMKVKLNHLKQENVYLKRMLLMTANQGEGKDGTVIISPPRQVSGTTVSPLNATASTLISKLSSQATLVYRPKQKLQAQKVSQEIPLALEGGISNPVLYLSPIPASFSKLPRLEPAKPQISKNKPTKEQTLEEKKEIIRNLYKKWDDSEEDIDSIVAGLLKTSNTTPSTLTNSNSATTEKSKRTQTMTLRNVNDKAEMTKRAKVFDDDDEDNDIEFIEEIQPSTKVGTLAEKYSDVIFENVA